MYIRSALYIQNSETEQNHCLKLPPQLLSTGCQRFSSVDRTSKSTNAEHQCVSGVLQQPGQRSRRGEWLLCLDCSAGRWELPGADCHAELQQKQQPGRKLQNLRRVSRELRRAGAMSQGRQRLCRNTGRRREDAGGRWWRAFDRVTLI